MKPITNSGTSVNGVKSSNKTITITTLQERLFFEGSLVGVSAILAGTRYEQKSAHGKGGRGANGYIRV